MKKTKVTNQTKNQNTRITAVLTAYSVSQIQCQYIPAESMLHTKEPRKCNILPSLNVWSLLSFSQGLGTIQLKYSMSLKHSVEDEHATGIFFSMLKDHMALQNAKVPYSYALVLMQKDVRRCCLSQECQDMLLRSLPLTGCTPCTRKPDISQPRRISCTAAEHGAGNPGTRSELWASSRMGLSCRTHTASSGLSGGTNPPEQQG